MAAQARHACTNHRGTGEVPEVCGVPEDLRGSLLEREVAHRLGARHMLAALLAATLPWVGWLGNAAGASRGLRRSAIAPRVPGTLHAGVRGFVPPKLNMTRVRGSTAQEPRHAHKAVRMSPWTAARAAWTSNSFHEFMVYMRAQQGDILEVDLWPVLPPIYLVMGKAANRAVLSELDAALEQVPCARAPAVAPRRTPTPAARSFAAGAAGLDQRAARVGEDPVGGGRGAAAKGGQLLPE